MVLGMCCGILVCYSDSPAALVLSLIYGILLWVSVSSAKGRFLFLVPAGFLLGVLAAVQYNALKLPDNKYYVKTMAYDRTGLTDRFILNGRIITVENYAQPQGTFQKKSIKPLFTVHEPVLLSGQFLNRPYDPEGNLFLGREVSYRTLPEERPWLMALEQWKSSMAGQLKAVIGPEAGSLAASLVLGVKDDLLRDRTAVLKFLGVIHILSISGFHVNLLESLLNRGGLRRVSLPLILGYALLVNSVPAWRAALMKLSKSAAAFFGRDSSAANQLVFAALIQLIRQPFLLFNKSFQLTYAATLGLIFLAKPISRLLENCPGKKLKAALGLSCAAMIPCIPFLEAMSTELNLALFPANILIVPLYSLFCVFAFLTIGLILLKIGPAYGLAAFATDSILRIINFLEYFMLEYFSLRVAWTGAAMIFLLVSLFILMKQYDLPVKKQVLIMGLSYFLLFNIYFLPGTTRITFQKHLGQAKVILQHNFKQYELVTEKMFKRSIRLTAIPVETPVQVLGLSVLPDGGDFPLILLKGVTLRPISPSSSDIISEEYLLIFGKLIRLK